MSFERPRPPLTIAGFTAGVMRISWENEDSYEIKGRAGRVHVGEIVECHGGATRSLPREMIGTALHGLVVQSPDGAICRVVGVESHCLSTLGVGERIGVLLVPLQEQL